MSEEMIQPELAPVPEPEPEFAARLEASRRLFEPPKGFETRFRDLHLHLAAFEGPLDLLLHLIREAKLDILDLPMAEVTRQYMEYLHLMEELNLEIAAEFVAMAAQLLQIKSRMMLPRPPAADEEDPREELVQKLLDYQQVKEAAAQLAERESRWRDVAFTKPLDIQEHARVEDEPIRATLIDLLGAYREALKRLLPPPPVEIRAQPKTLEQRVLEVLQMLAGIGEDWGSFQGLTASVRTREELVLTFLALLELVRTGRIALVQGETFGEIRVRPTAA